MLFMLVRISGISSSNAPHRDPMNSDDPFPEPVHIPVENVLDLHSILPRDARAVVEEYLIEANRLGFKALRIIHGRGIGVQRELVRSVLAATPFVLSYGDAPAEAGGWGATIVTLI
jgi:dsDNA-specific endonuclease/ATPase MutS2